jgi:hypothetical protein
MFYSSLFRRGSNTLRRDIPREPDVSRWSDCRISISRSRVSRRNRGTTRCLDAYQHGKSDPLLAGIFLLIVARSCTKKKVQVMCLGTDEDECRTKDMECSQGGWAEHAWRGEAWNCCGRILEGCRHCRSVLRQRVGAWGQV